jgi:transposase
MNRDELLKLNKEELLDVLLAIITKQAEEIENLKAQIKQNSSDSSKPPSSDGFKKSIKSLRKPSGKSKGGQFGHDRSGLKIMGKPDEYVSHEPAECNDCPMLSACQFHQEEDKTRYEVDIIVVPKTIAHQTKRIECPLNGSILRGEFPKNITSTMQYGVNLEALAITLNTVGMVSINRTHEILSGVFGIPISTGTISSMVCDCATTVKASVIEIKETITQEPVVSYDETGTRVDKKTIWAHVASPDKLTYIDVQEKRGKEGINAIGILLLFFGIAIHDCFVAYFGYDCKHGLCNAHLLRELNAVLENTNQIWAQKLIDLLLAMKKLKEEYIVQDLSFASTDILEKYSREYDTILNEALTQNPIPVIPGKRKPKRGKTGALVDRLILRKEQYLLFFADFAVPFDNNQAERDIRMFKVKQKVSGCFRTLDGARAFATISSYVATARKHGIPAFYAIKNALQGKPFSVLQSVTE